MRSRAWIPPAAFVLVATYFALSGMGCGTGFDLTPTSTLPSYLYLASGAANVGTGYSSTGATQKVFRINLDGTYDRDLVTYSGSDTPVGLADYDSTSILVAVESTARRIERISKGGGLLSVLVSSGTGLSNALGSIIPALGGGFLISKGSAIEKYDRSGTRQLVAASQWISGIPTPCAGLGTGKPLALTQAGSVVHFANSVGSAINVVSSAGYASTADCIFTTTTGGGNITSLFTTTSGKLLVGYSASAGLNQIDAYTATGTTVAFQAAGIFNNTSVAKGMSAIVELPDGTILVANAEASMNTIERFQFTGNGTLQRTTSTAFIANTYSKSISAMLVAH